MPLRSTLAALAVLVLTAFAPASEPPVSSMDSGQIYAVQGPCHIILGIPICF